MSINTPILPQFQGPILSDQGRILNDGSVSRIYNANGQTYFDVVFSIPAIDVQEILDQEGIDTPDNWDGAATVGVVFTFQEEKFNQIAKTTGVSEARAASRFFSLAGNLVGISTIISDTANAPEGEKLDTFIIGSVDFLANGLVVGVGGSFGGAVGSVVGPGGTVVGTIAGSTAAAQ